LSITAPKTGASLLHFTSYPRGLTGGNSGPTFQGVSSAGVGVPFLTTAPYDAQALNISFNAFVAQQAVPLGGSTITVDGIDPAILTNAQNYAFQTCTLRGGMGAGLPLANPAQAGILCQGIIMQVWANWVSATPPQLNLNFVVSPTPYTVSNPGNIVLNWRAGTPLATALTNTLQTAFPGAAIQMNIANIVLSHDEVGPFSTLTELAQTIADIAPGVCIVINGNVIQVFDTTYATTPKQLNFLDLVGQPMWVQPDVIQITTVLRGDIQMGDTLLMPQGLSSGFALQTQAALPSQYNYKTAMQGKFIVNQGVRHVGNFRQDSGFAWCSIFNCFAPGVQAVPFPGA
jgi:hypothetical protein